MIGRILAIAINTFREATRNKVLYSLLFFAVALIASALALGQMSLHEEARVTRDLGLGGIALFGVLIAIFVGVNLVYKELDRKTVFVLIPKPLHRHELIVGKFAGMALTLAVQIAIMSAVLFGVLGIQGVGLDESGAVFRAIVLTFAEVVVVTSIAVLFSSFSTPFLSGAFTLGIFIVGRSLPELRGLIAKLEDGGLRAALNGATHLFPDLHLFAVSGSMLDGKRVSVHAAFVDWSYVAAASGYGLLYAAAALTLAALLFTRRDFV
jgi:ABC-type transport system involved in multi-copper enzyme maturation permease subunit